MPFPRGIPYDTFPSGWYQFAWSAEVKPGEVKALHYFETDLVLYRGQSGTVHVFDAFCPHLGAHLGHGGWVEGDDLRCPFHGWRWDCHGRNVEIPYSKTVYENRRLRKWPVKEVAGLIMVWYDARGREPIWEMPELQECNDPDYYPMWPHGARIAARVHLQPQMLIENTVDIAHIKYVHNKEWGWPGEAEMVLYEARGPLFVTHWKAVIGTPKGGVPVLVENESWGLGFGFDRYRGMHDAMNTLSIIPVDREYSDMRMSVWVKRLPGDTGDEPKGIAKAVIKNQHYEILEGGDRPIMEHMLYTPKAPLPKEEAKPYAAFRKWCAQFYPDAQAEASAD